MIDFIKYQWIGFTVITAIIFTFVACYVAHNGFNYGIDFTGGTEAVLHFEKAADVGQVRDILKQQSWRGLTVSEFDQSGKDIRVRIQDVSTEVEGLGQQIKAVIQKAMPENPVELAKSETVSPSIGESLVWQALKAMIIAILFMLLYIFARFTFAFSMGAVASLVHDAIAIGAFFLLFNREVSVDVVAAVLMVLGYSMNDTIVIFSRIREQFKLPGNATPEERINTAINITLKRTLLTSFATLLVVLSVLFLGGEALRNLSLALVVGIFFGTYSSIFIASPVMLLLYKRNKREEQSTQPTRAI